MPLPSPTEWYRGADAVPEVWHPYVADVLRRHGLDEGAEPVAGHNPTYPTFVAGEAVVKFFGGPRAAERHAAETGALAAVSRDPGLAAPRLLGAGELEGCAWPYLVMSRLDGAPVEAATEDIARQVGAFVRRLHALPAAGVATEADWPPVDLAVAAARSSLPPHLAAQAAPYVARWLGPPDPVVAHGDVCAMHVLTDGGRVTGVIDWGDAMVTDRHYELIQVYRDLCACDRTVFAAFLDASGWPVSDGFPHRALAHGLRRQAVGLTQHHTIDVFMPVAEAFPLAEVGTLEELAGLLFGG